MWATVLHLVFGNAIIGVGEGLLLSWFFRAPVLRAVMTLILANYVSACVGYGWLLSEWAGEVEFTIENIRFWFWSFLGIAFVLTLAIEYPFFWFALRGREMGVVASGEGGVGDSLH